MSARKPVISAASAMVFDTWKRHVRALGELTDMDGPHDPDAELLKNKLTLSESDHFGLLRGEFTADRFITIHDTLQAIADELFEQYTRDHNVSGGELPVPPRSTLLALALEEMARRSLGVDPASSGSLGSGLAWAFALSQSLQIAGDLPGGLTRTNFITALRSMDMTNAMLLPGIGFNLDGNADAYFIEGGVYQKYNSEKQGWESQGEIIDLSGKSSNCAWDLATSVCKA